MNKEIKSIREKHVKGELAKSILKNLAIGGVLATGFALPNIVQLLDFFGATESGERRKIMRALEKIKKRKLVRIYEKDGLDVVEITESKKCFCLSF